MPRTIPAALQTHLQGSVLTTAVMVKVIRADGTILGLTTSNVNLTFAGILYEAMDSIAASQLRQSASTGVDNVEILGALQSARITDTDLLAGKYDGAALELFVVNYTDNPIINRVLLVTGSIGEVIFSEGQYRADFRSLSQRLQQKIAELTSATCRVRALFNAQCFVGGTNFQGGFTAASFQHDNAVVASVQSQQVVTFVDAAGTGQYDYGRVLWRTGNNTGLALEVKQSFLISGQMQLIFVFPWTGIVQVGDTALLEQGCDRTFATCVAKFNNGGNARLESYLPGNDRVIRWGRR
jgi:uncharacterized phage protein (TIGR02218 family)